MNKESKINIIKQSLKKINPKLEKVFNKGKYDFIKDGYMDSFDAMNLVIEIEKKTKKKIKTKKISENNFKNIESILKIF
jgi:acyl carrier protein|tara:strand:+ start:177 stop:413 length:237 start_codon:yes stop_codon:yes gene_type:complete